MRTTKNHHTKEQYEKVMLLRNYNLCPPKDWQWLVTANDPLNPAFFTLYAFKPGIDPEVYFIWLTDYPEIDYWLPQLYGFEEIRKHVLAVIFGPDYPDKLFVKTVAQLACLRENPNVRKIQL